MQCEQVQRYIDAYLDGELEATPAVELEQHMQGCADCRSALTLARLLKRAVREQLGAETAPDSLRLRIASALEEASGAEQEGGLWYVRRSMKGFAAAAAVLLGAIGYFVYSGAPLVPGRSEPVLDRASLASFPSEIFSDVVDRHVDQLPSEIETDVPEKATTWFRGKLGFRVRSLEFDQPDVHFVGARLSNVGAYRAAELYYNVGESRLTLVVFRPPASLQSALRDDVDVSAWGGRRERVGTRLAAAARLP
jgi:mycothiol system anti-sigma-R factor